METPQGGGRPLRARPSSEARETGHEAPGHRALQAAHEYLDGTVESPGEAGEKHGVDRQLVNYYVRKLSKQGVVSSERPPVPVEAPACTLGQAESGASKRSVYEDAWRYAAAVYQELGGQTRTARATTAKFGINFSPSSSSQPSARSQHRLGDHRFRACSQAHLPIANSVRWVHSHVTLNSL